MSEREQETIESAVRQIEHGWSVTPVERGKDGTWEGFPSKLSHYIHQMWKREPRVEPLLAEIAQLRAERDDWRTKALDVEQHPVVIVLRDERDTARLSADVYYEAATKAEADLAAARQQIADLRDGLKGLASWMREPGNVNRDDAVDECARAAENYASYVAALLASAGKDPQCMSDRRIADALAHGDLSRLL